MLANCPQERSCGGLNGLWSNDDMPRIVGFPTRIYAYATDDASGSCKAKSLEMEVLRCSWDYGFDFVYRFLGPYVDACTDSFCGMD